MNRTAKVISNIEESLKDLVRQTAAREAQSESDYLRNLILADLQIRGLLEKPELIKLVVT